MRILLAHNWYSVTGGAEVFYHEVARVLHRYGHEVQLFSPQEDGTVEVEGADLFPRIRPFRELTTLGKIRALPAAIYNRDAKTKFANMIQRFEPDIIHVFAVYSRLSPSILDAAREANVPVVLSSNDYKIICPNYKLYHHGKVCEDCKGGRFISALKNRCSHDSFALSAASAIEAYVHDINDLWRKNVTTFLFASRFMANKVEEFWGRKRVKIDFLQNPFDAAKHYVPPNVGDSILYFGRIIEEKGVQVLIAAARHAPEVPIVIVGDGPDRIALEKSAAALSNVRFVGPAWGSDLQVYLRECRAVVVPSTWHENFPYVILQAFSAHKPVIGSNRGGIPELLCAGPHGWVYDALDTEALAACMRGVMATSDDTLAEMGFAAQAYVAETFCDAAIYRALERIYQEARQ